MKKLETEYSFKPYISKRTLHEHGHVILEKMMGDELDILNNAKVSFNTENDTLDDHGKGVLRFLMEHGHGSPWESVVFRFDIKLPIFIMREHVRHRIASLNEHSQRYSKAIEEFYVPELEYIRTQIGKPGSYTFEPISDAMILTEAQYLIEKSQKESFRAYNRLVDIGVAKELARVVIPVGAYTRIKWTINLRSLLNYLSLRNHLDAQKEIVDYAKAVEELVVEQLPYTMEIFNKYGRTSP